MLWNKSPGAVPTVLLCQLRTIIEIKNFKQHYRCVMGRHADDRASRCSFRDVSKHFRRSSADKIAINFRVRSLAGCFGHRVFLCFSVLSNFNLSTGRDVCERHFQPAISVFLWSRPAAIYVSRIKNAVRFRCIKCCAYAMVARSAADNGRILSSQIIYEVSYLSGNVNTKPLTL